MLMAGLDGIRAGLDPGEPADYDLFEEAADVPQVPGSLAEALDALEADHEFLLEGGVFSEELIETWIAYKRETEVRRVRLRPHPAEFGLYFDCSRRGATMVKGRGSRHPRADRDGDRRGRGTRRATSA